MNLPLVLILIFATLIRFVSLDSLPISLFGDEIDVGYHAWSLITTGRDYLGNFMPSYIHSLSEYRAPLLMYLSAPFIGLFGPTTFGVRFAPALFGVISIYLIYLVTHSFFPKIQFKIGKFNLNLGHLAAFIATTTPWHIMYSRAAFESTLLICLILFGLYMYRLRRYTLSFISFALTLYTYSTASLFTPLFALGLFVFHFREHRPRPINFILPFLITLPIVYQILFGQAAGRFNLISIFSNTDITHAIVTSRTQAWSKPEDVLVLNKYFALGSTFINNYVSAFSPSFLFIHGDQYPRHHTGFGGQLLFVTLPLFFFGVYQLIRVRGSASFLLFWLLIAPLPSAITNGGGMHATRLFLMLPPLVIITSYGFYTLLGILERFWLLKLSVFILIFANLFFFLFHYSAVWRFESWKYFRPEFAEIMSQISQYDTPTNHVYINNNYEPSLLRFLFYTKVQPAKFQNLFVTDIPDSYKTDYFTGFKLGDKYYFGQAHSFSAMVDMLRPGDLYLAVQGQDIPGDWNLATSPNPSIRVLYQVNNTEGNLIFSLLQKYE